ncbi:hypothetical protein CDAR_419111 [Caerostris darwini]|uniref:Uncharacterized protein n=1 Tax=Caerostris darwini TaxID=1538125 RepID=A0AAV4MVC6_9ARAC|nr:hypothetical protein CDAR_419111 [Caerostris darwini]
MPLDGNSIKQTAVRMYRQSKEIETDNASFELNKKYEFPASTGSSFSEKTYFYHSIKIKGESASADELASKQFPQKLAKIIEIGSYTSDRIWSADESGLFWKKS